MEKPDIQVSSSPIFAAGTAGAGSGKADQVRNFSKGLWLTRGSRSPFVRTAEGSDLERFGYLLGCPAGAW